MTQDKIMGIVRHVLTIGAGFLVAKGTIDGGQAEIIAGSVAGLIGVIWSVWAKRSA